jgi:hypothetical protein
MSTTYDQNGHLTTHCCHPSTAVHTTEMALLASLIAEHKLITAILDDYPTGASEQIIDLLDVHGGAAKTLAAWRTAVALT